MELTPCQNKFVRIYPNNVPLEELNRKIKQRKRTCHGFANQKFSFKKILPKFYRKYF